MSLADARSRIQSAHRDLLRAWWRAEEVWRDENARSFKQRIIAPADSIIRNALNGMEKVDSEIAQMRRECELDQRL
jgi:hypothetical protein